MNLHDRLLDSIGKALVAHCVAEVDDPGDDVRLMDDMLARRYDVSYEEIIKTTYEIKLRWAGRDPECVYMAASAVGRMAYSLQQDDEKTTKHSLSFVMSELIVELDLNV